MGYLNIHPNANVKIIKVKSTHSEDPSYMWRINKRLLNCFGSLIVLKMFFLFFLPTCQTAKVSNMRNRWTIICPKSCKTEKDTRLNIGPNDVAGHVKVDTDEFSLLEWRGKEEFTGLRGAINNTCTKFQLENTFQNLKYPLLQIAHSQIGRSCHFWWSWHFRRPPWWDWPAGAASLAPPSDNSDIQRLLNMDWWLEVRCSGWCSVGMRWLSVGRGLG